MITQIELVKKNVHQIDQMYQPKRNGKDALINTRFNLIVQE